ncbi:MAG TPA: LysE family transporter [Steroidobacteraceae bacterium]|jgi:RhtB (resistance to homoserine/threonine) family protein|nr:LysE family transporter [Steroidobacteraceae bacterium]
MSPYVIIIGATLIWLAAVVSPGPNFLVVSRLALSRSRRSAIGATVGITFGSLIYAALTMFGLSVLILRFAWLGDTIRIVGGAYLVWLGIQAWRARPENLNPIAAKEVQDVTSLLHGLRVGFLTEITNPKGIAFFLGLFAAAVPETTPLWAKLAVLSAGGIIEFAWYTAVSVALSSGPMLAGYLKIRRTVDRVLGTLLIALGLKVALDAR